METPNIINNEELLLIMQKEKFKGIFYKEGKFILWELNKNYTFKITTNYIHKEGYIELYYKNKGKEKYITHWHPDSDEILDVLKRINSNEEILIVRNSKLFFGWIGFISKEEYEKNIKKYKSNIWNNYFVIK